MADTISRPEFVGDAIMKNDCGLSYGHYGPFILKSACQPIYKLTESSARMVAYEGLIRIQHEGRSIRPDVFFAQVPEQDKLFIESMCMALHIRNYFHVDHYPKCLFLNVNVANYESLQHMEREIIYTLGRLTDNNLATDRIVFEIIETAIMEPEILDRICAIFRSNNIRFALDDFGKESSNVERYIRTKPNMVKLDRVLFQDFAREIETVRLLTSLVRTFKENGVEVLLEGVESFDDVSIAMELGADLLQGYYLAEPNSPQAEFQENISFNSGLLDKLRMQA